VCEIRVVHCADVHLEAGTHCDYSFAVFQDILATTKEAGAQYLVISGDLFDSYDDAQALRLRFRDLIAPTRHDFETIWVPGNHEELNAGPTPLSSFDFGSILLVHQKPFSVVARDGIEFLCIPHQASYDGYSKWPVPEPGATRLVVAHGLVTAMGIYAGPDDEATQVTAGAIDSDLFRRFGTAYGALGHIHRRVPTDYSGALACYPGAARVWRHEKGPRSVLLVRLGKGDDDQVRVEPLTIGAAGEYRHYEVALELDGRTDAIAKLCSNWSAQDHIHLRLSGLVEDERTVAELAQALEAEWSSRVRRIEIDRREVTPVDGISSHPLARAFLKKWQELEPPPDRPDLLKTWHSARALGLRAIARRMEGPS
jgi:DNA repair exonuclease SbcCD nuclease subunit